MRRVRRLNASELQQAVGVLASDQGAVVAFSDGLCVIGDRVEVLARLDDVLTQVEQAETATWVVQLHLVSLADAARRDLGFDARPSLDVAATFAKASSGVVAPESALALRAGLDAVLRVAADDNQASLVAEPLYFLGDGTESEFARGQRVPIPRRVTSPEGTTRTEGFEFVQTGLTCVVSIRELRPDTARLKMALELSEVVRMVEDAPVTREDRYKTEAEIQSGGVYLLGELVRQGDANRTIGGMKLQWGQERDDSVLQVWARAYRVGGPTPGVDLVSSTQPPAVD